MHNLVNIFPNMVVNVPLPHPNFDNCLDLSVQCTIFWGKVTIYLYLNIPSVIKY